MQAGVMAHRPGEGEAEQQRPDHRSYALQRLVGALQLALVLRPHPPGHQALQAGLQETQEGEDRHGQEVDAAVRGEGVDQEGDRPPAAPSSTAPRSPTAFTAGPTRNIWTAIMLAPEAMKTSPSMPGVQ